MDSKPKGVLKLKIDGACLYRLDGCSDFITEPEYLKLKSALLIDEIKIIHSTINTDGLFLEPERQRLIEISADLTALNIPPIDRHYPKFKPNECDSRQAKSDYMRLLQACDLQWIHAKHGDSFNQKKSKLAMKLAGESLDDNDTDIFHTENFNWTKAIELATGFIEETGKHLTIKTKIERLRITKEMQSELAILRFDSVRKEQERERLAKQKTSREDRLKLSKIDDDAIKIKAKLVQYADSSKSRMKNIDDYICVWKALQISGGNKSNLVGVMKAYSELTGSEIGKSLLRKRLRTLLSIVG